MARAFMQVSVDDVGADMLTEETADQEEQRVLAKEPGRPWRLSATSTALLVSGAVMFLLGVAALSVHGLAHGAVQASSKVMQADSVASGQHSWQIVTAERDLCSTTKENCQGTMCCKTSGYHCFGKNATFAQCMKECTPNQDRTCTPLSTELVLEPNGATPATSLYCFSVYTFNTGSPKPSHEKELLEKQFEKKVSIFACNAYAVYSDVAVSLGQGLSTVKVTDVNDDFHFAKRKTTGAWVNTGMFIQVWAAIAKAKTYESFDWAVKVDPDAVFVPARLVDRIKMMPRTISGVFLQNCKHVDYGFFGNLEVFSRRAFSILIANMETCRTTLPWKVGLKNGKYGPMGEDLFAEICMEKNGVDKVEAFDVTIDGACEADRPMDQAKNKKWRPICQWTSSAAMHPFKKPVDYFKCLDAMTKQ